MTDQQNPQPDPPVVDPVVEPEVVDHAEVVKAHQAAVADARRAEYLAQTAESRKGQADDEKRHAAYDRTYLRFIDGTTATTAAKAKALAKDLGHEGEHIETRPV